MGSLRTRKNAETKSRARNNEERNGKIENRHFLSWRYMVSDLCFLLDPGMAKGVFEKGSLS